MRKTRFPPGFAREARFRCSKTDVILGIGLLDNVVDGAEGVVQIYGDLDAPHTRVVPEQDRDLGFFRKIGLHSHVQRPVLFPFAGLAARTPVRGMEGRYPLVLASVAVMLETVVPHLALTTGASMGQPNLLFGFPCSAADQARIALAARLSRTTDRRKRFPLR